MSRGEEVFDWHVRGDSLVLSTTLDGALEVLVGNDGQNAKVTLDGAAIEALIAATDQLAGGRGWVPEIVHEETVEQLSHAEDARDQQTERADRLEAELRARLADLEQARTALDLADRRARGLERDVERMRTAGDYSSTVVGP